MDEAASRVNPNDLKRLERARQRREDEARKELQRKSSEEAERAEALVQARIREKKAYQDRIDRSAEIYRQLIGRNVSVSTLQNTPFKISRLDQIVNNRILQTHMAQEQHETSVASKQAAKYNFNRRSQERSIISDMKSRIELLNARRAEDLADMELEDGVIDRFSRKGDSL